MLRNKCLHNNHSKISTAKVVSSSKRCIWEQKEWKLCKSSHNQGAEKGKTDESYIEINFICKIHLNSVCRLPYVAYGMYHTVWSSNIFLSIITRKDQKAATLDLRNDEIIIAKRKELTKRVLEMYPTVYWHKIKCMFTVKTLINPIFYNICNKNVWFCFYVNTSSDDYFFTSS